MVNVNYRRGRDKEYRLKWKYEKLGYMCYRSAGSHSPIDLTCIHKNKKEILLIQSKPRNFSRRLQEALMIENNYLNDEFICKFMVM